MRYLVIAIALALVGCGGPRATPAPTTTPVPTVAAGYVTKAELGADWPFSVDAGTLACYVDVRDPRRMMVTFTTGNGIEYGINGSARAFGYPDADDGMIPTWPDASMLGPVIARGLELCT